MAYLLFGTGVLLVLGSVIYTYRVDRKVRESSSVPTPAPQQVIPAVQEVSPPVQTQAAPIASYAQVMKRARVKDSISCIGEDLDELIDELREKEAEVKDILNRVKGWKAEQTPDPDAAEVSNPTEAAGSAETCSAMEEEAAIGKEAAVADSAASGTEAKYTQMILLLEQGHSPEEVARTLHMGQREVELVQKMRQKGA